MLRKLLILLVTSVVSLYAEMPELVDIPTPSFLGMSTDSANVWVFSNKMLLNINKKTYIPTENEIEFGNISAIANDREGNLYVACSGKLMKYDGISWFTYDYDFLGTGTVESNFFRMDSSGTMYYYNFGLYKIDGDTVILMEEFNDRHIKDLTFTNEKMYFSDSDMLCSYDGNIIDTLARIPWTDDDIRGIVVRDDEIFFTSYWAFFSLIGDDLEVLEDNISFSQMKLDDKGQVWLSYNRKLYYYDKSLKDSWIIDEDIQDFTFIDGHLWVMTESSLIKEYEGKLNKVGFNYYPLAGKSFLEVVQDKSGLFWFRTSDQIYNTKDLSYGSFVWNYEFIEDEYNSLDVSDNGNVWIGGNEYIHRVTKSTIIRYKIRDVPIDNMYHIICGKTNNIYVKHIIGDMWNHSTLYYKFDFDEDKFDQIDSVDGKKLVGLSKDNLGRVWFITDELLRYNNGDFERIELPFDINSNNDVSIKAVFSGDSLWIIHRYKEVYLYNGTEWNFINTANFFGVNNYFWDIFIYDGKLLLSSILGMVEYKDGEFEYFNAGDYSFEGISANSHFIDKDGNLWLINYGNIFVYHKGGVVIGVEDNMITEKDGINISPNPASDYIEIRTNKIIEDIELYDVYGSTATCYGVNDASNYRIDVSHLPAGIYFVRVGDEVLRFVKM